MRLILLLLSVLSAPAAAFELRAGPQRVGRSRLAPRSASVLASASLTVTQPAKEVCRQLGLIGFNFVAVGGGSTAEVKSVYGDSVGSIASGPVDELRERVPDGQRRWVLSGTGSVAIEGGKSYNIKANSLVEVSGEGAAVNLVWKLSKGCDVLVVGSNEADSPARVAARAAVPYVLGGLGAIGVVAVVSDALGLTL